MIFMRRARFCVVSDADLRRLTCDLQSIHWVSDSANLTEVIGACGSQTDRQPQTNQTVLFS